MSYQTPISIWHGDTAMDDWYRESVAHAQQAKIVPRNMLYTPKDVLNRDSNALPSTSFYETYEMTGEEGYAALNKKSLRVYTDKPLPSLPENGGSAWDYMFSDIDENFQVTVDENVQTAKSESKPINFVASMSPTPRLSSTYSCFESTDGASPPSSDSQPATPTNVVDERAYYGYDGTPIKQETPTPTRSTFVAQYVISCAGSTPIRVAPVVPIVPINHATGTLAVDPFIESKEIEVAADATAGFYGGYAVEESPSPYHAPNIDENAGFGDIRDGCETIPDQWTDEETQAEVAVLHKATANQASLEDFEVLAPKPLKKVLQPKSQIAKAARTCDMGFGLVHRVSYTPRITALSGFDDEVVAQLNGKPLTTFPPFVTGPSIGIKRVAQDSSNKSFENSDYYDSDKADEAPQSVKKARVSSHVPVDADVAYAPLPAISSPMPDLKRQGSKASISNSTFHDTVPFAPTEDGFLGQFNALLPPSKIFHAKFLSGGRPKEVTFGSTTHANGLFHHTRFQPGGNTPFNEYSLVFSMSAVPSVDGPLGKALKIADENHTIAADTKRTVEQDKLRRETHLECSIARLEGVAVGEYRYYQGHSGIEEYNMGGMCICWDECFCTKMCTKYADMLCPCAKYIEFDE